MEFEKLVSSIQNTHEELQLSAIKAVNQSLTLRNWLIGLYIIEFEQKGKERAKYGEQLLPELAASIKIKGLSVTNLKLCRQFYIAYPHLISAVKDILINSNLKGIQIGQTVSDQLQSIDYNQNSIHQSTTDELKQMTNQNKALVEYAIADSDQQLFVSKYLLELPSKGI